MAFKILPEEDKPSSLNAESLHRLPAQAAKGIVSQAIGLPGDVASVLNIPAGYISEKVTGQKAVPYEETQLNKIFPTSVQHKNNLEEGIPYLKPKNKIESFVSEVTSDATGLALPGGLLTRAGLRGTPALRGLYSSLAANIAGEGTTQFTGDPELGSKVKTGAMLLTSLFNKPTAQAEVANQYQRADRLLPANATTDATRLEGRLTGLRNRVLQGRQPADLAPSEAFVIDEADTILRQIQNGQISVPTLRAALRSLNERLQQAVFQAPNRATRTRARALATEINQASNQTLAQYGQTNPEWWRAFSSAQNAFGTMQQSNFISRFIQNNVTGNAATHGLLQALGVSSAAATGIVPYMASKIIYQISHDPTLARHYARIVASASAENAPLMNKEIKKLDQELEKKSSKSKFRIEG